MLGLIFITFDLQNKLILYHLEPRFLRLNILSIGGVESSNVTANVIVLNNLEDLEVKN